MTSLRIAFVAVVIALSGCKSPTCDPKALPEGYSEAAALLPSSAVICAARTDDNPKNPGVRMEFPTRDVKGLTYETMLKLRDAKWVVDKSSNATDLSGSITARQKGRMLTLWISKNSDGHVPGFLLIQETNF